MAMPTLRVQLLGDFHLTLGASPSPILHSSCLQSLLAYLILHRSAPQTRQHLAFLFWSDSTEVNARNNLRQLLFELRRILPDANRFFDITDTAIQLRANAPFTCDVIEFEERLTVDRGLPTEDSQSTVSRLQSAVDLYRGDLLPSCYDDWIASDREILRDKYIHALTRLIALLEQANDLPNAIDYAQRLLRYDPIHESTYRYLMRLYVANGDRANALRTYHACATNLQRELAVDPSAETHAEYERLLNVDVGTTTTPALPSVLPLIGRQREWTQLQTAWRRAASGHAHMIVLQGEAGVGKTRLAEELIVWVNRQGIANARTQCYATENALAFAPVATWLRARPLPPLDDIALIDVARILPDALAARPDLHPLALTEHWQRQRMFTSIAHALLPNAQPLLFVLDDLQWCDRDTLDWLDYFLHSNSAARACIVATLRVDELDSANSISNFLSSLTHADQLTRIDLALLDQTETTALASSVAGYTVDASVASKVYCETEGNPLFVIETMRARLLDSSVDNSTLPPKVQSVILTRLERLSSSARNLLNVAAIIGREFSFDILAHASEQDEDVMVLALDELWQRRIIREQSATAYDFSHDKLRQVVLATMSGTRQRLIHRRVAQALEIVHASNLDAVSAEIATQYEHGGFIDAAIRYWDRAATAAREIYAHAQAIDHYRRVIALFNRDTPIDLAERLHENLGDLLHLTGQYDPARNAFQNILELVADNIIRARAHRKIGNTFREQYLYSEALQAYNQGINVLNQTTVDQSPEWWHEWIQIQLEIGSVYYWLSKLDESDRWREMVESIVKQHGTPIQRASFFQRIISIELIRNRWVSTPETISLGHATLAAFHEAKNDAVIPSVKFQLGLHTLWFNDLPNAIEMMGEALRLAEQRSDPTLQARCLTYLTVAYRKMDNLEQVEQLAMKSLQIATSTNMPEYMSMANANLAWCALRESNFKLAQEHAQTAFGFWKVLPSGHASSPFKWLALFPVIVIELRAKQVDTAINHARILLEPNQQKLPDQLATCLEQAIQQWDNGASISARDKLNAAIKLAQELKYL